MSLEHQPGFLEMSVEKTHDPISAISDEAPKTRLLWSASSRGRTTSHASMEHIRGAPGSACPPLRCYRPEPPQPSQSLSQRWLSGGTRRLRPRFGGEGSYINSIDPWKFRRNLGPMLNQSTVNSYKTLLERRETRKVGQREEKRTREAGTKMQCSTW